MTHGRWKQQQHEKWRDFSKIIDTNFQTNSPKSTEIQDLIKDSINKFLSLILVTFLACEKIKNIYEKIIKSVKFCGQCLFSIIFTIFFFGFFKSFKIYI